MTHRHTCLLVLAVLAGNSRVADAQVETGDTQDVSNISAQTLSIRNLLSRFDADGDGQLSVLERARVRQFIQQQNTRKETEARTRIQWQDVVQRYDADGDGVLNATERLSALNTLRKLAGRETQSVSIKDELISRLDVNRDGRVDASERGLLTTQINELRESAKDENSGTPKAADSAERPLLDRATLISRFDVNQDGRIDTGERVRAQQILSQGGFTEQK